MIGLLLGVSLLSAQEGNSRLDSYRKNFERASVDIKKGLITDVAQEENAVDFAPLFFDAVVWVVDNFRIIQQDSRVREIALTSVEILEKSKYLEAAAPLWQLYQLVPETNFRIQVLKALGKTVTEQEPEIIELMNVWLAGRNSIFQTGGNLDTQVIYYFVGALGEIKDPSSFAVLFDTYTLQMNGEVRRFAETQILSYEDQLADLFEDVISKGDSRLQREAIDYILATDAVTDEQRTELCRLAVAVALQQEGRQDEDRKNRRMLRYAAAKHLGTVGAAEDADLLVDHFEATLEENRLGVARRDYLLESIASLGATGTETATERLTRYLHFINLEKENNNRFDEQVLGAVLKQVKALGNPLSFDELTYMRHLKYSSSILAMVEEALNSIKWE